MASFPNRHGARWACPARGLKAPEWKDAGRRAIGPETVTTGGNGQSILKAIGAFAVSELRPDDSI